MKTLDDFLPVYEFSERHRVSIRAEPERIDAALREVTLADSPVTRTLFALRGLRLRQEGTFLEGFGKRAVLLDDVPGEGVVFGLTGKFWKPGGEGGPRPSTAEEFLAYDRAGACKAVLDFRRVSSSLLTTETRVHVPDSGARRSFRRYWRVVRPFSGLTRILLLRATRRRAEA